MFQSLNQRLLDIGIPLEWSVYVKFGLLLAVAVIVVVGLDWLTKWLFIRWIRELIKRIENPLLDAIVEKRVLRAIGNVVHVVAIQLMIPIVFTDFRIVIPVARTVNELYIVLILLIILSSFFNALGHYTKQLPSLSDKPIDSYVQLSKIIIFSIGVLFGLSIILGKSLPYLFGTLGATSAILLLVFKDTILGFVASIQLSVNDMVRIGDWIENPKYGADGDVIQITLTTVKVQNWDKTITTIPTYVLVSDAFKNWRGMKESGGRRIKRAIYFKMDSFRFCDEALLERVRGIALLKEELNEAAIFPPADTRPDREPLTNIGLFRQYAELYLQAHPQLNHDLLCMVRQLAPREYGLPLEIYAFTSTVAWVEYEAIQAKIFDHLLTITPLFDLDIYQMPSGKDIESIRR